MKWWGIGFVLPLFLTGCELQYLAKNGYYQAKILANQISLSEALQSPNINEKTKEKIRLSQEVVTFMQKDLGLKTKGNYSRFVLLDQDYVTYAVVAADKSSLTPYLWKFPIVGEVPYKGYFTKEDALTEAKSMKLKYDVFVRGVSAFSTLGWLKDPLLSSMTNMSNPDLVDVLIHETIHANLFIKNHADFNERLATFLGHKGTEAFYLKKEGSNSFTLKQIKKSNEDSKKFSHFISDEIKKLETWYQEHSHFSEEEKKVRLKNIQTNFQSQLLPKMQTQDYGGFEKIELNNAVVISYKTYMEDLSEFESTYERFYNNYKLFFAAVKALESSSNPQEDMKQLKPSF